ADAPGIAEAAERRVRLAAGVHEPHSFGHGPDGPDGTAARVGQCPNCGAAALTHQEGCDVCLNCGYSRCG
ncbi:MAG TPA: hypothetical protein VFE11_15905, partial [Dongiaceae bacterium]|nr:hypothetical protein [Dongiaceae bacterium]